jgi:hypothetical protein
LNKTNIHLSPKIIEHKKNTTYDDGNPSPDLEQAHKCGGVKLVYGIPPNPSPVCILDIDHFIFMGKYVFFSAVKFYRK